MNILRSTLVAFLLCSTTTVAAPASDSSIKHLLEITQSKKLIDGLKTQLDSQMDKAVQQALQGKSPTPKQQKAIENMKNKMVAVVQDELAWEKLEVIYLRLYKESFSEEEVAGVSAFYNTPAGQALIHKMPVLMQQSMIETQKMISGMTPKLKKVQEQFVAEMASASK